MTDKKVIAVVGATGAQGGGLVRAICEESDGEFIARALTRNPSSDQARALERLGAEVAAVNIDDENSLRKAFEGAYGAFCVTFFWDHFSPDREKQQAHNMAKAAKDCGLKHVIWSTLEDTRNWMSLDDERMPTLMEKYKVPHLDAKGEANAYFEKLGVPTTFLLTSFYMENFIYFGMGPKQRPDGDYAVTLPMENKKLPMIATEDIGRCALGIFQKGQDYAGKTVGIAGEHLMGQEIASEFSKALGLKVRYEAITPDLYRRSHTPGAEDLGNMFQFKADFNEDFCGARSVEGSRSLNPRLQTFSEWLRMHKDQIKVE